MTFNHLHTVGLDDIRYILVEMTVCNLNFPEITWTVNAEGCAFTMYFLD